MQERKSVTILVIGEDSSIKTKFCVLHCGSKKTDSRRDCRRKERYLLQVLPGETGIVTDKTCRYKGLLVFIYFAMFGIYAYGLVGCLLTYLNAVGLRLWKIIVRDWLCIVLSLSSTQENTCHEWWLSKADFTLWGRLTHRSHMTRISEIIV